MPPLPGSDETETQVPPKYQMHERQRRRSHFVSSTRMDKTILLNLRILNLGTRAEFCGGLTTMSICRPSHGRTKFQRERAEGLNEFQGGPILSPVGPQNNGSN